MIDQAPAVTLCPLVVCMEGLFAQSGMQSISGNLPIAPGPDSASVG